MAYNDCPQILREFLLYMQTIKNLSQRTVDGYYIDLRLFMRYLKLQRGLCTVSDFDNLDEIDISDVSLELVQSVTTLDVYEYLHFVMKDRNNNPNTRARKVSSLRSYFKYLTTKVHKLKNDPVKDIEVPSIKRGLPKFLSLDESLRMLQSVEGDHAARDYCILTLFLNCGMRLSELVGINCDDIRDDTVNITGKGNKERIVYLNEACLSAIASYYNERDAKSYTKKDPKALFLSRTGSRLTTRRVEQIVEENLRRAGLDNRGYSTHKLRHTAATLMYRHGNVDMLALKEILGHEHVSTTEIYTHISDDQLRNAAQASPLSGVKPPKAKARRAQHPEEDLQEKGAKHPK
jgi:site-specific recombinase XerD